MRGRSTCWYNGLSEGRFPAAAPPAFLLSDEVTTAALHPELTALCEAGESGSWWREDGSFASMFKNALSDQNFAIVDGLWDAEATERVRGECEAAYSQGLLSPATVTTAGDTGRGRFPTRVGTMQRGSTSRKALRSGLHFPSWYRI